MRDGDWFPRVARAEQPWAGGWNPVGIQKGHEIPIVTGARQS